MGPLPDDAEQGQARQRAHPVQAFGRDHDDGPATRAQKTESDLVAGYFESHGWVFGVSVVTRRDNVAEPVEHSAGMAAWHVVACGPDGDMIGILMTQRAWTSPTPPDVCLDFWTSLYQAIDD